MEGKTGRIDKQATKITAALKGLYRGTCLRFGKSKTFLLFGIKALTVWKSQSQVKRQRNHFKVHRKVLTVSAFLFEGSHTVHILPLAGLMTQSIPLGLFT